MKQNQMFSLSKLKILLYSGRATADPRFTALVELGKLPYNNFIVTDIDGVNYNFKNVKWDYKDNYKNI